MPRTFRSLNLWLVVAVVCVTGLAAVALGAEAAPPAPRAGWSTLAAI